MFAQSANLNDNQEFLSFAGCDEQLSFVDAEIAVETPRRHRTDGPRMTRSVVDVAGLGRFVYLEGRSGKRYVFSPIKAEQVALYDRALFAAAPAGGACVQVAENFEELRKADHLYYVHLLDADSTDVVSDLIKT